LTIEGVIISYQDYSSAIKLGVAFSSALTLELIILIITRQTIMNELKNPQSLLIGILVGLCLPNNLPWWEVSITAAFAIIVGRHFLGNRLNAVLIGYLFSLVAFPTLHGYSSLIKNDGYNYYMLDINGAFALGGLFLAFKKCINWRIPITLIAFYVISALVLNKNNEDIVFSISSFRGLFNSTTCLAAFFIAPFILGDKPSAKTCFIGGTVMAVLFLEGSYAQYPNALLLALLLVNIFYWSISSKNILLHHQHITHISTQPLLTPILSASLVMVITSTVTQAAIAGAIVMVIYISVQSISDVIKRYIPQSNLLSLVIVLTAFLSAYIGLSLKVYWPEISQHIDDSIPLLALSNLILSCSVIFTGNAAPFNMINALKTSALFLVFVLLVGAVSQFTDINRTLPAGLFFLFALIALYNNPTLSNIEIPENKPNRRVRTTGTIK
jgi:electron transport complex protein RnfD